MQTIMLYNTPVDTWFSFLSSGYLNTTFDHTPVTETINEYPTKYVVAYHTSGYKRKNLSLKTNNNQLIVEGYTKTSSGIIKKKHHQQKSFRKLIPINDDMNIPLIKARFKNNNLLIEIPKKQSRLSYREIPVNSNEQNIINTSTTSKSKQKSIIKQLKNTLKSYLTKFNALRKSA